MSDSDKIKRVGSDVPALARIAATAMLATPVVALLLVGGGATADAAPGPGPAARPLAAADFGTPPSGEFPILYNDRSVYAGPDVLKRGRVLAALVKDGHVYVPLRSMFEQMGATVSTSADGKHVSAIKPGSSVSVTLGDPEVVINGDVRPLDVPPMMYKGVVLVPVRVLSEALGAYVQWVPEKRVVVVRYLSAPVPPPAPTPTPSPVPIPLPTAAPIAPTAAPAAPSAEPSYRAFVQAAFSGRRNYNEFSAGEFCPEGYVLSAGYAIHGSPLAVKVDYRQDVYVTSDNRTDASANHYTSFATIDGGTALVPVFLARQSSLDTRLEYQVAAPRVYVGVGYLHTANNYGYPHLNAIGAGIEKLPALRSGVNFFGSAFYYPAASGTYTVSDAASPNAGKAYRQQYQITKYDVGLALVAKRVPVYLYAGVSGDHYAAGRNAPIGQTHDGPYLGLGVKL